MTAQGRRACAAVAAVAVAVVAAMGVDLLLQAARPSVAKEALAIAVDPDGEGSYAAESGTEELADFEREVLPLSGRAGLRASSGGTLVGFTASGGAAEAFAAISDELEGRGWTAVSSGSAQTGTFAKGEGTFRWAFVSCADVGGEASVVVQCA